MPRRDHWTHMDAPYNGETRQADGVTVFVSNRSTGAQRCLVRRMMPLVEALREIVAQIDGWPGEWGIDVISTPSTIWRDLQGSREQHTQTGFRGGPKLLGAEGEPPAVMVYPEQRYLGQIHRADLFHKPGQHG